jgi:hypothetical protein
LIVVAVTASEQQDQVDELEKQMQLLYQNGETVDTCNGYSTDCTECLEEGCGWVMISELVGQTGRTPATIGSNNPNTLYQACRTAQPMFLVGGEQQLIRDASVAPATQCNAPFAEPSTFTVEQCAEAAEQRQNGNCGLTTCTNGQYCCPIDGSNTIGVAGTCVSSSILCVPTNGQTQCGLNNPFGR